MIYQVCCHPDCDRNRLINYSNKEERKMHFGHLTYNIEDFKAYLEIEEAYDCFRKEDAIE